MLRSITFAFLLLACAVTANAQTSTHYYRFMGRNGYDEFVFYQEVFGADTAICRCYRATYDASGALTTWTFLSAGMPQEDPTFDLARVDISHKGDFTLHQFFDAHGNRTWNSDRQAGQHIMLDRATKQGMMVPKNTHDQSVFKDKNGVTSYEWILDDSGRIFKVFNLDDHDKRIYRRDSIFETDYLYDKDGFIAGILYFESDGKPLRHGRAAQHHTHDGFSTLRMVNVNAEGAPLDDTDIPAKIENSFDSLWYITESRSFEASGKVRGINKSVVNRRGCVVEKRHLDADSKPTGNYPIVNYTFDDHNLLTDEYRRDGHGRMLLHIHREFTPFRDLLREVMTDSLGRPTLDDDTYSEERYTYNEQGRIISDTRIGPNGQPIGRMSDGVASQSFAYNNTGDLTEIRNLDASGKPHVSDQGYARFLLIYDRNGFVTDHTLFDAEGRDITDEPSGRK